MTNLKELHSRFYYKDGKLYHKERALSRGRSSTKAHTEVGSYRKRDGYRVVGINWKRYLVHRIIWMMCNNKILPDNIQLDHINGIRDDNRVENLREVSNAVNHRNSKMYNTNTTGYVGVDKLKDRFVARIKHNYKKLHLGVFETAEKAYTARKIAEVALGFHKNHGRVV